MKSPGTRNGTGGSQSLIKETVRQLLRRCGYSISNLRQTPQAFLREENLLKVTFDLIVAQHLLNTSDFFFIQVGAFDGVAADPIREFVLRYNWKGILIEPQNKAFERLKENYAGQSQLIFKNAAISDESGMRTLYTVADGDVPEWCQGLASFDREVILKHQELIPGLADLIQTEQIQCTTFLDLIREGKVDKIDLLQVDVEGYDSEVICMFPFELVRPSIVHFERKHLSPLALEKCLDVLLRYDYKLANDGEEDLVAYAECGRKGIAERSLAMGMGS